MHLQRDARAEVGIQAIPLLLPELVEVALYGGVVVADCHGEETRARWACPRCRFPSVARHRLDGLAMRGGIGRPWALAAVAVPQTTREGCPQMPPLVATRRRPEQRHGVTC